MAWRYKPSNKYGNHKTEVDGIVFDSMLEAKRYGELKLMQRAGMIENLELQPRFVLQPSFKKNGKTIRKIEYVADFAYQKNGQLIVEDTKSPATLANKEYRLKKKLFEFKYPELTIKEITQ